MASPYAQERHIAELAVLKASILTKKIQASVSEISKADDSPVTVGDFATQALLISALRNAFPGDTFVGEEDSTALRSDEKLRNRVFELALSDYLDDPAQEALLAKPKSMDEMLDLIDLGGRGQGDPKGRFWVMDPIDGTATFLRGEQYAVSLALIEGGKEVVGVLGCPNLKPQSGRLTESTVDKHGLGLMFTAVTGQGATIRTMTFSGLEDPAPLGPLQSTSELKDLHIVDCAASKTSRHDLIAKLASSLGAPFPGTEVWSSHIRYAALLVGGGDFQLRIPSRSDTKMWMWDHAGAQLILKEAGGKVTDLEGREINFGAGRDLNRENKGLVAARKDVHGLVLERLRKILDEDEASS